MFCNWGERVTSLRHCLCLSFSESVLSTALYLHLRASCDSWKENCSLLKSWYLPNTSAWDVKFIEQAVILLFSIHQGLSSRSRLCCPVLGFMDLSETTKWHPHNDPHVVVGFIKLARAWRLDLLSHLSSTLEIDMKTLRHTERAYIGSWESKLRWVSVHTHSLERAYSLWKELEIATPPIV